MNIGQKSTTWRLGYAAQTLVPTKSVSRGVTLVLNLSILFAIIVGVSTISLGSFLSTPWFLLLMLLASVVAIPAAKDILIAGGGPSAAIVLAILGNRPGSPRIYQASSAADASRILKSTAIRELIVADDLEIATIATHSDVRGIRPAMIDATDAVGNLLGRLPVQLIDAVTIEQAAASISFGHRFTKRTIDIVFSLTMGLLVLPLMPVVALLIRLDSPGGAFYSQERVGLNGKLFQIYKFRSMRQDAERNGAMWTRAGDSRVTRIGRFMRITRIDELPQLWNVLRGDMTLVGPRPERPEFTTMLEQEIPGYALRTTVKPGLTGWAQVSFRYTNSVLETRTKLEYDLYYVRFASIALELRILFQTVVVVVRMRGR